MLAALLSRISLLPAVVIRLIQVGALDKLSDGRSRTKLLRQARLWLPVIECEFEVLRLLVEGCSNAAIASYPELGCSRNAPDRAPNVPGTGLYTGIAVGWSALCYDKEHERPDRDQTATREAVEQYRALIREFPDTGYSGAARERIRQLQELSK